jgi:hypothetical protein
MHLPVKALFNETINCYTRIARWKHEDDPLK